MTSRHQLTIFDKIARHYRQGTLLLTLAGKLFELSTNAEVRRLHASSHRLRQPGIIGLLERSVTRRNLRRNQAKRIRHLEIGPEEEPLRGFETLNIVGGRNVDYVLDATQPLPFADATFDEIYSSHVLEHLPWYRTEAILREWVRILKPGGRLNIWVPDALKICATILGAENGRIDRLPDGWQKHNPDNNPYLWAAGRLFYGANPKYPSWHRAFFTPRFLKDIFCRIGLTEVRKLPREEIRGFDHGWINLGVGGTKPEGGNPESAAQGET
jgi:SAM-dependent methyltransferase